MKANILARRVAALTLPAVLVACGGGGSSDIVAPGAPVPGTLSISGTAATGAAIVGGTVNVKCAAGTSSPATTIANGSYTITVTGGTLPCVLRVDYGTESLHSLVEANGGSVVRANVTPFTQLIAAQVAGGDPASLYTSFDASAQTKLSAATVASAITTVTAALAGTANFAGANPLTTTFVIGDAFDQQLDAFKAALVKAQVSLSDVTTTLVASGGTAAPLLTLLQPAAATCAGLRSGRYRFINLRESDPKWVNHVFQFNADTLTATYWDGTSETLVDKGGCTFTVGGTAQLLVTKSGVTIARDTPTATPTKTNVSIVIPEQTITLNELAGTWNAMGYVRDTALGSLKPSNAVFTLGATGQFSAGSDCLGVSACTVWTAMPGNVTAGAAGGFEFSDGVDTYKVFAFKAADGQLSLYVLEPNGSGFSVAAKQQALSLPTVSAMNSAWDFTINSSGYASTLGEIATTVKAVDTTAQSFTRERASDGRIDSFHINNPRNGLRHRAAGSSVDKFGATVTFSEIISMPLPGTGIGVYSSVAANQYFFGVSVNKP